MNERLPLCFVQPVMKVRGSALLLLFPLLAAADPVEDLEQALQRLKNHSSYAWETTIVPAQVSTWISRIDFPDPDAPNGRRTDEKVVPAPIEGVTDRALGTVTWASLNVNDSGSNGRLRVIVRDGHGVAETRGGWKDEGQIDAEFRILANEPIAVRQKHLFSQTYVPVVARLQISLRPPAEELSALLADANPAMLAKQAIVVTLSEATAKKFIFDLRYRDGFGVVESPPAFAEGRVTFWLNKGEIERYEVKIEADVERDHGERTIHFVKNTLLRDFEKARVEIPPKALAKLNAAGALP